MLRDGKHLWLLWYEEYCRKFYTVIGVKSLLFCLTGFLIDKVTVGWLMIYRGTPKQSLYLCNRGKCVGIRRKQDTSDFIRLVVFMYSVVFMWVSWSYNLSKIHIRSHLIYVKRRVVRRHSNWIIKRRKFWVEL